MQQIPLNIRSDRSYSFENFWAKPYDAAVQNLQSKLLTNELGQGWFLQGGPGTGKTHLLGASAEWINQQQKRCYTISSTDFIDYWCKAGNDYNTQDLLLQTEWLDAMTQADMLCLDDMHLFKAQDQALNSLIEELLFRLLNRCLLKEGPKVLLSSREPLEHLPIKLADLRSRLGLLTVVNLKHLSDQETVEWLAFKAGQLGFRFEEDAAQFLLKRWPRDLHALSQVLEKLDEYSLLNKRAITVPAIKQVLSL